MPPIASALFVGLTCGEVSRAICDGTYDPGSKLSDTNEFCRDALNEIHELGIVIIRYPGGNFVASYK